MRRKKTYRIVYLSLLISMATILNIFEKLLPVLPVPGASLGLANIFTLVTLNLFGFKDGFVVAVFRVFLASLITSTFGNVTFYFSISAAVVSSLSMGLILAIFKGNVSNVGVSIVGAIFHNVTQLFVASKMFGTFAFFSYLPYLLFFALPTGFFVGVATNYLIKILPKAVNVQEK